MENTLQCLCGKVFTVVKSPIAHESQCKVYRDEIDDLYSRHHRLTKNHHGDHRHKKKWKHGHRDSPPSNPLCYGPRHSFSPHRRAPTPELQVAPIVDLDDPPPSFLPGQELAHNNGNQVPLEVHCLHQSPWKLLHLYFIGWQWTSGYQCSWSIQYLCGSQPITTQGCYPFWTIYSSTCMLQGPPTRWRGRSSPSSHRSCFHYAIHCPFCTFSSSVACYDNSLPNQAWWVWSLSHISNTTNAQPRSKQLYCLIRWCSNPGAEPAHHARFWVGTFSILQYTPRNGPRLSERQSARS